MRRRRFIALAGGVAGLSGCLATTGTDRGTSTGTPTRGAETSGGDGATRTGSPAGDATPTYRVEQPVAPEPAYRGRFVEAGELLDNCETTTHWRGDVAADADRSFSGSRSIRIEGRDRAVAVADYSERPLDLTDRDLSLAYYPDRPDAQPTLYVDLHAPDFENRVRLARPYVGNWPLGWQRLDLGPRAVAGDPDLSTVTRIQLALNHDRIRGWIDDVRTHPKPDRGAVVFRFDDGDVHHYTDYYPVLDRHGYPGVECVNPKYVGETGKLTVDQLDALVAAGWDLANHTYGHRNVEELPPAAVRESLDRSQSWLSEHGFDVDAFVYPYGAYDGAALAAVGQRFDVAFSGGGLANVAVTNPLTVASWNADGPVEATLRRVDRAAAHRSLLVLMVHGLAVEKFERVVGHVRSKGSALDVLSASELWDRARGLHDAGEDGGRVDP